MKDVMRREPAVMAVDETCGEAHHRRRWTIGLRVARFEIPDLYLELIVRANARGVGNNLLDQPAGFETIDQCTLHNVGERVLPDRVRKIIAGIGAPADRDAIGIEEARRLWSCD